MNGADSIETIHGSIVQHGNHNGRIYIMHLATRELRSLVASLDKMADEKGYGKIVAKIPASHWDAFKTSGYTKEALVPGYFKGKIDGLFIAKFFSPERQRVNIQFDCGERDGVAAIEDRVDKPTPPIVACSPGDARALAAIYQRTFKSYAFPIDRPAYLEYMMRKNVFYFCIRDNQNIIAAAATDIDSANMACEMTDFATLPEYRGRGLAGSLLDRLDDEARLHGLKTAYTIARADSVGMNRVFLTRGYRYAGRLINNTQIDGRIRSMNVWYRLL
jgi:beta-lysine N6-acetyltransferase